MKGSKFFVRGMAALALVLALVSLTGCPTDVNDNDDDGETAGYTVTYNGNGNTGGSAPTDTRTYSANATVTALGNTGNLTKTGYTFDGWNTKANGSGDSYAAGGASFRITADTTLYAKWTDEETAGYTVTYNGNGNTGGSAPTDTRTYAANTTVTAPGNTGNLTKTGYTFDGWNTEADSSGMDYAAGGTFTITADTMLYAKWTEDENYSISLKNGTDDLTDETYTFTDTTPLTVTVTNTGTNATGPLTISLTMTETPDSGSFSLDKTEISDIAPGEADTFTITLPAETVTGVYSGAVSVEGGNSISAVFDVSYTIFGLSHIEVTAYPDTTVYQVGDTLDLTGMVVTAVYTDYSTAPITDYTLELQQDGMPIAQGDTITDAMWQGAALSAGITRITVKKEDKIVSFSITIKAPIPSSAMVGISLDAYFKGTYNGNSGTYSYTPTIAITLTLPDGGEWIDKPDNSWNDDSGKDAIKSWVSVNAPGITDPAVSTWGFSVSSSGDNKLTLRYTSWSSYNLTYLQSLMDEVTAVIDQSKVTGMKDYTNIAGTFTASTTSRTDNNWNTSH